MSLSFIIIAAVATVAATFITAARVLSFKTMAKYATVIDIVFTIVMLLMFAGTLTGMLVAILSGLLMAICLSALKVTTKPVKIAKPSFVTWAINWVKASRLQWPVKQHPDWAAGNF